MSLITSLAIALLVTFSHLEFTWLTVDRVVVMVGALRNTPAPAMASPLKKEMPRRSWGMKPPAMVREMSGSWAWKGRAVTFVFSL